MRGLGTMRINNGNLEINGYFDNNNLVNGKGYKKWKRFVYNEDPKNPNKKIRVAEIYVYRGQLKDSKIDGYGEFKWPDGRHYIGDFNNQFISG